LIYLCGRETGGVVHAVRPHEFPRKVTSGPWLTTSVDHVDFAFPRNGPVKKLANQ